MADRQGRIKALVSRNISDILTFELKNKRIGIPSVNEVILNGDNSIAKVYVSFLGAKYPHQNLEELNRCKGFVRSSLAKKMDVYKVPDIIFVYDDQFDRAESLDKALRKEENELSSLKKESK